MENITKGYYCTYDARNLRSRDWYLRITVQHIRAIKRYPVQTRKVDIKKAAAPAKVSCFLDSIK